MQTLEIGYYQSVLDKSELADHWEISIEDHSFSHGGFGEIFHIINIDGVAPEQPLVLKLFFNNKEQEHCFDAISQLGGKVFDQVHDNKNFLEDYPALRALPLCIFGVEIDGIERDGYVMYDLAEMDLIGFDKIAVDYDEDAYEEFENHDLTWRLTAAYHLVRGFHMLEKMRFLHADISADNIFIGKKEPMAVILDYDSGAVIESKDDTPSTFGKNQPWLAPEILFQLKGMQKKGKALVDVNIYSDRWAVANAIVQILTSMQALYLTDLSEETLRRYSKSYQWPKIDTSDSIFMEGNEEYYEEFIERWKELPEPVRRELDYTFNKGMFNPQCRTSYGRWEMILRSVIQQNGLHVPLPTPHTSSAGNNSAKPKPSPKNVVNKTGNVEDLEAAKEELNKYMDVLVMDIISGSEKIEDNKFFIDMRAQKAEVNPDELISELKDFIEMFNTCRKHKPSQFELKNLRYQGSRAFISLYIVDNIIDRYCK
ncbi:MAG: protein kinase [Bacteroidaceae bacterium]|nr:protein kinase [Bacteroidaceae bacterium]